MKTFMTFNPHIENLSQTTLLHNFSTIIKKFYRQTLGPRYYKHKNQQFPIGIFQEIGSKDFKQPHLHIILDIPLVRMKEFYNFLRDNLKAIYPSLTSDCQIIGDRKHDLQNVFSYCLKEGGAIVTNSDLCQRNYTI